MKKTAIFMLSLALVAGMLSGCSGDSSDSSAKDSSSAADSSSVVDIRRNFGGGNHGRRRELRYWRRFAG